MKPTGNRVRFLVGQLCVAVVATAACASDPPASSGPRELDLGTPTVVIAEGDALLAAPRDLGIDAEGRVYVLDRQDMRIVVVGPDGEVARTIGQEGQGPGEFSQPSFLGVTEHGIRVYDSSRQSVQVFDFDGRYVDEYRVGKTGILFVQGSFSSDGTMAYGGVRMAGEQGLVVRLGPEGGEPEIFGDLVAEPSAGGDFITEEVHQGLIPQFMRNNVLSFLTPGGDLWLFLLTESLLQRYSREKALVASTEIYVPESEAIRAEYFDWYVPWGTGVMRFFAYVVDGFATEDRVWLLWSTPPDDEGLITVHDETGAILWRLLYTLPRAPPQSEESTLPYVSRRYLAVDEGRGRAYLANTDDSSLSWFDLPAEVLR